MGLGQEPADADHPARRGLHDERRHDRGAARRGRRPGADGGRARGAARRRWHRCCRRADCVLYGTSRVLRRERGSTRRDGCATAATRSLRCFLRSTSATRRRSSGSTTERSSASAGASRPRRSGRATSSARCSRDFLDFATLDGICLASTVPRLIREYEHLAERWVKAPLLVVGPGVKTGIQIHYDDPREVGPDRVVNAVAAKERYGAAVHRRRLRHLDELRRRLAGRRVRRRRARAGRRGLDGRAFHARGASRQGRLRRAAVRDRQDDRNRAPVRPRLRVRRTGGRHRRRDPQGARRGGDRRSRPAASPS